MKKIVILLTLVVGVFCVQADTNSANRIRKQLRHYILREQLNARRMNILGLKSTKVQPKQRKTEKVLLGSGSSAARQPLSISVRTDGWEYTITTNDVGQITKYAVKGTNTVTFIWNDFVVPMRYRLSFMALTEEQKSLVMGYVDDLTPWTEKDPVEPFITPKKIIEEQTDANTTEEIRETQTRW